MKKYQRIESNPHLSLQAEARVVMASWRFARNNPLFPGALHVEAMRISMRPRLVKEAVRW